MFRAQQNRPSFNRRLRWAIFKKNKDPPAASFSTTLDPSSTLSASTDSSSPSNVQHSTSALVEPKDDDVGVLVDLNQTDADRLVAEFVQQKESKELADSLMMATKEGKAVKFVQAVLDLHGSLQKTISGTPVNAEITTVAVDEMVWFVERMLTKQDEFKALGVSTLVDIGYHYTTAENLERIRTDGLLSKQERTELGIQSKYNGSAYGDGIYTGDDPTTYRTFYGPVCLLVARLKGRTTSVVSNATYAVGAMVVLRSSAQCVPMIQFTCEPDDLVRQYHDELLSLIDTYFNAEVDAVIVNEPIDKTLYYTAPSELNKGALSKVTLIPTEKACSTDDCAICLNTLEGQELGEIQDCGHQFHYECLTEAIAHSSRCPLCSKNLVKPQGKMPSGEMKVTAEPSLTCGGHAPGAIKIDYWIKNGIQMSYHSNPGASFDGASRTAYLPDTTEGQLLLKRLEYAFLHGLTFAVGTSLTTGKHNCVTWASIHHKTQLSGGSYGFPDPNYFFNCNEELDALGVPSAFELSTGSSRNSIADPPGSYVAP